MSGSPDVPVSLDRPFEREKESTPRIMQELKFWQVDAFSDEPYKGNPAAIVFEADVLTSDQMQTIARQMNLSETVFLCKPSGHASYRARIFTPTTEVPFAGHPTIASAFAHASTHKQNGMFEQTVLLQECGAGTIPVTVEGGDAPLFTLASNAEPTVRTTLGRQEIGNLLGITSDDVAAEPAEVCSIGLPWLIARVASLESLQGARPDLGAIERTCREYRAVGITAYALDAVLDDCDAHVRTFAPGAGIPEDPVCGSGNGSIAVHLARHLYRDRASFTYRAEQGLEVQRSGRLHLTAERGGNDDLSIKVHLGGRAVKVLEGKLWI